MAEELDELLACRLDLRQRKLEPATVVIFGASGDLTARKLVPALFHLFVGKQLPSPFRIIGFARRPLSHEAYRAQLRDSLRQFSRSGPPADADWDAFAAHLFYCRGDMDQPAAFAELRRQIEDTPDTPLRTNLLFYLAVAPDFFGTTVEQLSVAGLLRPEDETQGWRRVVVEKPFGQDLGSARELNESLTQVVSERQLFRIDHYLGKETVQNLLMFRFSNAIFEPLWNRQHVDHVQIVMSEKIGVGARGPFYESTGAARDIFQNHLLQILALFGMEPPVSLEAEAIRDEKVKLLQSVRPFGAAGTAAVRGQYTVGPPGSDLKDMRSYREEDRVSPQSMVETYVAARLLIDNWRWSGVPFFIRSGKRLPLSATEVRVQFRRTPNVLFAAQCGPKLDANSLTLRLQPHEGMQLRFNGKVPGTSVEIRPVRMQFSYDTEFGAYTPEAYERLLLDALAGDATLFIRRDEVETSWRIVDPMRAGWETQPLQPEDFYPAGSWGPVAAENLILETGHTWRNPLPQW